MIKFSRDDVEILGRERVYDGYFKLDRYALRHRMREGGWTGRMAREVLERGHTAAVLPYDPVRDEVVLLEQFRIGAYAAGRAQPWLIEIVAGVIGAGETAEDLVRREAVEEAGLEIAELEPVASVLLTPGACSENIDIFVGRADTSNAGGVHGLDHEDEDILVRTAGFEEAETLLRQGGLSNAITVIALQWLVLNRADLRARWR